MRREQSQDLLKMVSLARFFLWGRDVLVIYTAWPPRRAYNSQGFDFLSTLNPSLLCTFSLSEGSLQSKIQNRKYSLSSFLFLLNQKQGVDSREKGRIVEGSRVVTPGREQ